MANHMKAIASMLGVELGEEFEVDYGKGRIATAKLKQSGLEVLNTNFGFYGDINRVLLEYLLNGSCTIKRKPWKPKRGDQYYFVETDEVGWEAWSEDAIDMMCYKLGNCYPTEQEAEANIDKWKAFYASDEVLEV